MSKHKTFESGAIRTRDADKEGYNLVCPRGLKHLSRIYKEGETKYPLQTSVGVNGSKYVRGLPFGDTVNHMIRHLEIARKGGDKEGPPVIHFAKVAWGCFTLIHFLTKCKHHRVAEELEKETRKGWDKDYGG